MKDKQRGVAVLAILGVLIIGGFTGSVITANNESVEQKVEQLTNK